MIAYISHHQTNWGMKVQQQFAGAVWDSSQPNHNCGGPIRPLAAKHRDTAVIRPDSCLDRREKEDISSPKGKRWTWQQGQSGSGVRWSPAPEQIGVLERLYLGGMRTPDAEQIERITAHLSKYGKIEGKNVFYWFQNHKARERQKLKRTHSYPTYSKEGSGRNEEQVSTKRKCVTSWAEETIKTSTTNANYYLHLQRENGIEEEMDSNKTLELLPLHPQPKLS